MIKTAVSLCEDMSTLDLLFTSREEAIEDKKVELSLGNYDQSLIKLIYQYEEENLGIKVMFDYMKGDYEKNATVAQYKLEKLFYRMHRNLDML